LLRWVQKYGARPLDEFIEQNSYTQTREYMKKALDIYARYEWLYARRDYLPDEKIDAAYLHNEIDY
jgi:soluble lytic murein transglycosylase-like protein